MPAAKGFNMIYYVEDDDNIRDLTVYALRKQGIEAEGFSCDGEFKAAVARRVPDAVLLDIMLPDTDGLAIMRRLRADRLTATVPIMMLTAKDTELDKVMALDGGADDYLTKPFRSWSSPAAAAHCCVAAAWSNRQAMCSAWATLCSRPAIVR